MLDLIVFSSAVAITRYIGQKNPLLSPPPSSAHFGGGDRDQANHERHVVVATSSDDAHPPIAHQHAVARYIFHACLLLSLLLFSLSVLEAAPIAWLVMIDRASLFVAWYRALLWAQCALLLVVHPCFLGAMAGASVFGSGRTSSSSEGKGGGKGSSSTTTTPPSPSRRNAFEGRQGNADGRRRPLRICLKISWIGVRFVRFFLVTILWRLFRKVAAAMIPYRITRVDGGGSRSTWKKRRRCTAGVVATASISLCLSLLSLATIGSLVLNFDAKDDGARRHAKSVLTFMVSIICAFGMIVASILNGFGCASLPHANLVGVFLKPTPPSVIAKVEEDFHYAMKTLEEKRWMLEDGMSPSSSLSSSFTPSKNKVSSEKQRMKQLQDEIVFLQTLVGDMNDDIEEMKHSQRLSFAARTAFGRVRYVLGLVFSVVLVVRVVLAANSFLSIMAGDGDDVNSPDSRKDPLTSISLWLMGHDIVRTREQYDLFRQGTSLLLAGALSVSQVRAFLRVVGALGRRLGRACRGGAASFRGTAGGAVRHAGADAALLLSSFVMGCYFLACVTVVKMTLPMEYRSSFSAAIGLNFNFNAKFLNVIFFGSACVSAVTLASLFGIQRNNSERYQLETQLSSLSSQLA